MEVLQAPQARRQLDDALGAELVVAADAGPRRMGRSTGARRRDDAETPPGPPWWQAPQPRTATMTSL